MSKPELYTKALAYCAFQAAFIAFLFSFYEIEIPLPDLTPATDWAYSQIDRLEWFDFLLHNKRTISTRAGKRKKAVKVTEKSDETKADKPELVLSPADLAKYDGRKGSRGLYLAILGKVYNVDRGRQYYGPAGGYHFFAGKDGSRAFVTGDFTDSGLVDDIQGLSYQDVLGIEEWIHFYDRDYEHIGYVHGTYYDSGGKPTSLLKKTEATIAAAHVWKEGQRKETEMYPPCNSEWHKDMGGRVWCSHKSGGIERDWIGVPRKLFKTGTKQYRCACIKNYGAPSTADPSEEHKNRGDLDSALLEQYAGCSPTSNSCKLPNKNDDRNKNARDDR